MASYGGSRTFQVHANVNSDHGDSALRVTISFFDDRGLEVATETWRGHARSLSVEGLDWMAYSAVVDLCRMMGNVAAGQVLPHDEVDTPLF